MRIGLIAMAALLCAAPAYADVKAGVDAWARGDYRRAVEEWREPAVGGDADAQFNLGQAYKLGRGVPVDPQMAESWFRKAALQGHEQAGDNYGLALFQAGRKPDAVPWLEKSVARDEPRAELVLGTMLFNGDGVPRDYPRAYALMTRAAAVRGSSDGLQSARETLAQMDAYISPRDRERGTALAQQYLSAAQTRPAPAPGPMRVTEAGPRTPEPVQVTAPSPRPTRTPRPTPTVAARPPRVPAPVPTPAARPVATAPARPAPARPNVAAAPAARGGAWRVQLGAFRSRANAESLWARVRGKVGGQPAYIAADPLTRLLATGFAGRPEAQAACRRSGVACNVVAP